MSKKVEIKVYLPAFLVGRLEEKKKAGIRSKFIENAILQRLKGEQEFDLWDCDSEEIIDEAVVRLRTKMLSSDNVFAEFCERLFK